MASLTAILRQNIGFFDRREHSTGSLLTMLGSDASAMSNFSGLSLGAILTLTVHVASGAILAYRSYVFIELMHPDSHTDGN